MTYDALPERPDTLLGLPITWVEGDGKPLNIIIGNYGPNLEFVMPEDYLARRRSMTAQEWAREYQGDWSEVPDE